MNKSVLSVSNVPYSRLDKLSKSCNDLRKNYDGLKEEHRSGKLVNSEFHKKIEPLLKELNKLCDNSNGLKGIVPYVVTNQLIINEELSGIESTLKSRRFRTTNGAKYGIMLHGLKKDYDYLENRYKSDELDGTVFIEKMEQLLLELQDLRETLKKTTLHGKKTQFWMKHRPISTIKLLDEAKEIDHKLSILRIHFLDAYKKSTNQENQLKLHKATLEVEETRNGLLDSNKCNKELVEKAKIIFEKE